MKSADKKLSDTVKMKRPGIFPFQFSKSFQTNIFINIADMIINKILMHLRYHNFAVSGFNYSEIGKINLSQNNKKLSFIR